MIEHYKKSVVGAVNSYIRMINESDKYDVVGKGIIDTTWRSTITSDGCFHIHLKVNGHDDTITLTSEEWNSPSANHMGNAKLKEFAERFSQQVVIED